MRDVHNLKLTSHVGRDLLQSAASFKTEHAVVWEYVVNSLQYVDEGVAPKVQVTVRPRANEIEISDNGRGMAVDDLARFFKMHAENLDRLRGRAGRGKFGTGKSAAFGVGRSLQVDARRNGRRNVVLLTRQAIDASSGHDVPLDWRVQNEETTLPNGTTITIGDIVLTKINTQSIIEYIERHLQAFRASMPQVAVNNHICQYREPNVVETFTFQPTLEQSRVLGDVQLTIKVSPAPLPETEIGVAVTAGVGNFVAVETGGVDRKELGNYLFGEIDVPALETLDSVIEPYDASRSLQLNPQHPVAVVLIAFVASKLEEVRLRQVRKLADARKTEQARRLSSEAEKIAKVLNQDFLNVASKLQGIRAAAATTGNAGATFGKSATAGDEQDLWREGTSLPGQLNQIDRSSKERHVSGAKSKETPHIVRSGSPNAGGDGAVDPTGGEGKKTRPKGGFRVEYRELGQNEDRSKYDRTSLTILINLDHPAVRNALRGGAIGDVNFRRLSYEIAFTEYSVALGYEMAGRDPDIPADDLLYEVRATLNRVATAAASLYTS